MTQTRDEFLKILQRAIQKDASDIHLKTGQAPYYRVDGIIESPTGGKPLQSEDVDAILNYLLTDEQAKFFGKKGEIDLAFTEKGVGRFRTNVFRQRGTISIVMRRIKTKILTWDQLNLPKAALRMADLVRGLALITGTTGSGKSTALAAIVDSINERRRCHIVTIEDPIEFVHQDKRSVVNQREVTIDTHDFTSALKAVMRQDPDVILVGEMRDHETFQAVMSAAETGHLVFSTLHTTNVKQTIDRIIDLFPTSQQTQILSQLANNLRAIMCMRLLPRADGVGRVPCCEYMLVNHSIRKLVKEGRSAQLSTAIMQGREDGMQTFNDSLYTLIKTGLITHEEGMNTSENPEELNMMLQGIRLSSAGGGLLG